MVNNLPARILINNYLLPGSCNFNNPHNLKADLFHYSEICFYLSVHFLLKFISVEKIFTISRSVTSFVPAGAAGPSRNRPHSRRV